MAKPSKVPGTAGVKRTKSALRQGVDHPADVAEVLNQIGDKSDAKRVAQTPVIVERQG